MSKDIKSKKYPGVYYRELADGDRSYYILITINDKNIRQSIGRKSEGYSEVDADALRTDIKQRVKYGDEALETLPFVRSRKKKKNPTLSELSEKYISSKIISKATTVEYNTILKYLDADGIGLKDPSNIKIDDIQALQQKLNNEGKAAATINKYLGFIKSVYNYGIRQGNLKNGNPVLAIKKIKENNERQRHLSQDETTALYDAVKHNQTLYLFSLISLQTGARLESVLHIQAKDIDLLHDSITLHNIKSHRTYTGFLADELKEILTDRLSKNTNPNEYIISFNGSQTTVRQIQCRLKPIIDKLFNQGLDAKDRKNRAVIHTLRHTFASHLAIKGVDLYKIKKLMDHSNIKETERYAKLAPDSGKESIRRIFNNK